MNKATIIAAKRSFFITLTYVGLGTVSVLCLGLDIQGYEFLADVSTVILFLTIPVTCISFAVMYSSHDYGTVLIIQSVIFLLFWYVLFLILRRKIRKRLTAWNTVIIFNIYFLNKFFYLCIPAEGDSGDNVEYIKLKNGN